MTWRIADISLIEYIKRTWKGIVSIVTLLYIAVDMTEQAIDNKKKLCQLEDDEEYDYITVPPDGGFGWVVLIACFVSHG